MRFELSENFSSPQKGVGTTPVYTPENLKYTSKGVYTENNKSDSTKDHTKQDSITETSEYHSSRTKSHRCQCRPAGKSASWGEADAQDAHRRKHSNSDAEQPIAVHYYYGKLIQVSSSKQVQIGNNCTMDVHDEGENFKMEIYG